MHPQRYNTLTLQLFHLWDLPLRSMFREEEVEDGTLAHTPCENIIGPIFLPAWSHLTLATRWIVLDILLWCLVILRAIVCMINPAKFTQPHRRTSESSYGARWNCVAFFEDGRLKGWLARDSSISGQITSWAPLLDDENDKKGAPGVFRRGMKGLEYSVYRIVRQQIQ